jgi:hypothetical protein
MELDLNYSVMAYAQKAVFLYGRNGRVHILSLRWIGAQRAYSLSLFLFHFRIFAKVFAVIQ